MSGTTQTYLERLHLSKEPKKEIYIDLHSTLQQHHIDGIRFLYKQFIKKNAGVILNDPIPTEHILQVVLFVTAIRKSLTGRVLILCNSWNLHLWSKCFHEFTNILHELAVDVATPVLKKSIFVIAMEQVRPFCNREWGAIVVDDDEFLSYKDLDKNFKADYKIFITTHSMKENLNKFAMIYKWFYPKEILDIEEFITTNTNISDAVAKTIRFEAFVEDIVIGRTNVLALLEASKELPPENRVRKKNKDATGTKIKRSKRKIEDNTDVPILDSKKPIRETKNNGDSGYKGVASLNSSDFSISNHNIGGQSEALDVESFIRDQEPIQSYELRDYVPGRDDSPQKSEKTESHEDIKSDNSFNICDVKENTESMRLHYSEDVSQSLLDEDDPAYSLETQVDNEIRDTPDSAIKDVELGNSTVPTETDTHELYSTDLMPQTPNEVEYAEAKFDSEVKNTEAVDTEANGIKQLETPKKDVDAKLMELEERIMKKFKGSLLDKIF